MTTTTKPSQKMIAAARRELKRRAARQSLANFVLYTTPGYKMGWVHQEICDVLDAFLADVVAKKSPRLIICMPPRSGKSQLVSRAFPAYAFGRNPDLQIIASSYSADLSQRFSRDVQRAIDDTSYREVFPNTYIAGKGTKQGAAGSYMRTADLFEVVDHKGTYRACGVGGGITGMGADILLIDDPLKDRRDANSETMRNALWDWYTSTAYTRLSPGGGVIVMNTRWHLDDLVGRLIQHDKEGSGDTWRVINYPAIAEHDEPHRKAGEALHPERYPLETLLQIKKTVGSRDWASLYQQQPVPDGGGLFKSDWIQHWDAATLPNHFDTVVCSWDMTFKGTDRSDYVVGQVWGRKGGSYYLLDQVRGQWDFVKTTVMFEALADKWPDATRKLVEDKANGSAVISMLKKHVSGIIPVTPKESKEARAYAVSTLWEAKNVYLPPKAQAPWIAEDFIPELLGFPAAAHDDQCFAAGTMIATPWGSRPIEMIKPGDYVLTPFGFKRVLAAGQTGEAETIERFGISATRNHPFFTKQGSFKDFCKVKEEECSALTLHEMLKASRLLRLSLMESDTDSYPGEGITLASQRQTKDEGEPKGFTSLYGSISQGRRFLRAMKSITKTAIRSTTTLATWSVYRVANIARRLISRPNVFESISMKSDILQPIGIEAKRGGSGIVNTQNDPRAEQRNAYVFAVESRSWPRLAGQSSVRGSANANTTTTTLLRKNEPVSCAGRSSLPLSGLTDARRLPVAESVPQFSVSRRQPVFNLMIEDAHCYYANGKLVHNCDAMTQALSDLIKNGRPKIHASNLAYLRR